MLIFQAGFIITYAGNLSFFITISDLVYIFIDYSNVTYGSQSNLRIANDVFNVDPNRLVITVCNGRKLGGVFIAGSDPPIDDELWVRALDLKFNVNIFPLIAGREKKVDTQLAVDMMDIIYSKNPGTLVLVSGDADFIIPLDKAKEKNWRIEIWSWSRGRKYRYYFYFLVMSTKFLTI